MIGSRFTETSFLIFHSESRFYDLTEFAKSLDASFVQRLCTAVHEKRASMTLESWKQSYGAYAKSFFHLLSTFTFSQNIDHLELMSVSDWRAFVKWASDKTYSFRENRIRSVAASRKNPLKAFMAMLGQAHIVPIGYIAEADISDTRFLVHQSITKNTKWTYDYSAYANAFGDRFVEAVCIAIKAEKEKYLLAGKKVRSFITVCIIPIETVFNALRLFINEHGFSSPDTMHLPDWFQFTEQLWKFIDGDNSIDNKGKILKANCNNLLRIFARNGVIPIEFNTKNILCNKPYFVYKPNSNRNCYTYDYSEIAERIGTAFMFKACCELRDLKESSGVIERSWIDNYVCRFDDLIIALTAYLNNNNIESVSGMTIADWTELIDLLGISIHRDYLSSKTGRAVSDKTKSKIRFTMNNLLGRLAIKNIIPRRFEIPSPLGRKIAPNGLSIFTQRGREPALKQSNERLEKAQLSRFSFCIKEHQRKSPYDFLAFQNLGEKFILELVISLKKIFPFLKYSNAKKKYNALNSFLTFLLLKKEKSLHIEFFDVLFTENYKFINDLIWEKILYDFREECFEQVSDKDGGSKLLTQNRKITELNALWALLAHDKIVPVVEIRPYKNARARSASQPIRSLAQLSPPAHNALLFEVQEELKKKVIPYFDTHEQTEAIEFVNALCHHLPSTEVRALALNDLITRISKLNADRLATLRRCAESDFLRWKDHWERGQAALATATHSSEMLVDLLENQLRSESERRRNSTKLLFSGFEKSLGNCLLLTITNYNGILSNIGGKYHHIKRMYGGHDDFHAFLHPHPRATLALWVMLLIDTGANCEVIREMPFGCLEGTNDPSLKKLFFGKKERSAGMRIQDQLAVEPDEEQKISSVQAIGLYQKMSNRLRQFAPREIAQCLFLDERDSQIIELTEFRARDDFIYFLADHPELENLKMRPSFIRPSYLLKVQHADPKGRMEIAQDVGDHFSMSTTKTYTLRAHTKLLYAQKIREFQNEFQAVIIASIEGAAEKLGISIEEAQHLFSEAARSGLGIACLNSKAGIQPGTKLGEDCSRLDACPSCEMRYIVGTINNICDLMLFQEYLLSKEEDAVHVAPSIWERRWLPWLVLAEIALAKLQQGETASAYMKAKALVPDRRSTYKPFPLY